MAQQSVSAVQNNQNVGMREVMQLLQMLAARGSSSRRQRVDNPYTATAVANAQVNNPTRARAGTRKSSGGQSSGAKKTELQERVAARKKGRADRRSEFIASNKAKTTARNKEKRNYSLYRKAMKNADREMKLLGELGEDIEDFNRRGRKADIRKFRNANPLPDKGPLDALALMGQEGRGASVPVDLPANQVYGPQGQTTTELMGPDMNRIGFVHPPAGPPVTPSPGVPGMLTQAAQERPVLKTDPDDLFFRTSEPIFVQDGPLSYKRVSGSPYNVGSNPIPPPPPPYNPPGFEDSGLYATELNSKGKFGGARPLGIITDNPSDLRRADGPREGEVPNDQINRRSGEGITGYGPDIRFRGGRDGDYVRGNNFYPSTVPEDNPAYARGLEFGARHNDGKPVLLRNEDGSQFFPIEDAYGPKDRFGNLIRPNYNQGGFGIQQGPLAPRNYGFTGRPNPLQGVFGPNPYAHYPPVPQPQNPLSNFPPGSFQY